MVVASTQEQANQMAKAVDVKFKSLGKPVLTIQDAIASESFFPALNITTTIGNAIGKQLSDMHYILLLYCLYIIIITFRCNIKI